MDEPSKGVYGKNEEDTKPKKDPQTFGFRLAKLKRDTFKKRGLAGSMMASRWFDRTSRSETIRTSNAWSRRRVWLGATRKDRV